VSSLFTKVVRFLNKKIPAGAAKTFPLKKFTSVSMPIPVFVRGYFPEKMHKPTEPIGESAAITLPISEQHITAFYSIG